MRTTFPLFWLALYRRRRFVAALAFGLVAFETLIVVVAAFVPTDQLLSQNVPSSLNAFSGSSGDITLASVAGLLGAGMLHPFWIGLQTAAVASFGAAVVAGDVEDGTIELIAVRPLSRVRLWAERVAALFAVTLLLHIAAVLPIAIASLVVSRVGDTVTASGIVITVGAGFLLTFAFAGVAVAMSCTASRKAAVFAVVGGLVAATYALNFIAASWRTLDVAKYASPFHYYQPADALTGRGIAASSIAVLAVVGVLGLVVGLVRLQHRDLTR